MVYIVLLGFQTRVLYIQFVVTKLRIKPLKKILKISWEVVSRLFILLFEDFFKIKIIFLVLNK